MKIYCCGCKQEVGALLTFGREIYPHRKDLYTLPFWKCEYCGNYVGCHHKTKDQTRPLGVIPTKEIRECRKKIHAIIDPLWRSGTVSRKLVYKAMSEKLNYKFHSAEIRNEYEAKVAYETAIIVADEMSG